MAKEKNLTNVTSVASGDYVRVVTSGGASVKATVGNFSKLLPTVRETYTPTITGSNTGFTSANASFLYQLNGGWMIISGRFQVTNAGTGSGTITITLPTGYTYQNSGFGGCGAITADNPDYQYMPRLDDNATLKIVRGGGGGNPLPNIGTGYIGVFAVVACS